MEIGYVLVAGLLTSFHCVAMCGTMVATYAIRDSGVSAKRFEAAPHIVYHSAKLVSYTAVGLLLGAIGQALDLGAVRGTASLLAGGFMVLLGLNMLNVHPVFRIFSLRMPKRLQQFMFKGREAEAGRFGAPAAFGLLSGFMPCGPLQAMQLYAAGTGSAVTGAAVMFLFGAMTIPTMLAFGAATQVLGHTFKRRIMTVGALVVLALGVIMFDRGLNLAGSPLTLNTARTGVATALGLDGPGSTGASTLAGGVQEARLVIENTRYVPDTIALTAGVPVRLTVDRRESGACSDELVIPAYGVQQKLRPNGTTVIEFTPERAGRVPFTCQMGMMSGAFLVTASDEAVAAAPGGGGSEGGASGAPGAAGRVGSAQRVAANRMLVLFATAILGVVGYRRWSLRVAAAHAQAGGAGAHAGRGGQARQAKTGRGAAGSKGSRPGGRSSAGTGGQADAWRRESAWVAAAVLVAILAGYALGTYRARTGGAAAGAAAGSPSAVEAPSPGASQYVPDPSYSGTPPQGRTSVSADGKTQTFELKVVGGYQPSVIRAKAGVPLSLGVVRNEQIWCTKYLVFPELGIQRELPDSGRLTIEVPALKAGRYRFTCQMNMLSGELVVEQ